MKRTIAIVLSLILIGIQAMAAVQTTSVSGNTNRHSCCAPSNSDCCCVTQSTTVPLPLPAVPASTVVANDLTASLSMLVVWTLPASAPSQISPSAFTPSLANAVPLFTRDCALLI